MVWRRSLEEPIKRNLELQIRETHRHRNAYKLSKNPSKAQLWVAIANLSKHIFELNLRMNLLERSIKDLMEKTQKKNFKPVKKKPKKKTKKKKK